MESTFSTYDILFRVKILHHYYLDVGKQNAGNIEFELFDDLPNDKKELQLQKYNIDSWLAVSPDKLTAKLIRDRGLIYKIMSDGFVILTAVSNKKPVTDIDHTKYIFDLFFQNDGASISALSLTKNGQHPVYYVFNNETAWLNGNINGSLCQTPPAYDNTQKYAPGEIVSDSGGHYMALNKIGNLNKAVTNTGFWKKIKETIRYTNTSNLLDRPEIPPDATASETLVLSESQPPPTAFGRIEISENKSIPNGFRVLNTSNQVQQKIFEIRINHL